jgi:DNA-binding NarL/FixJ family response regulator
MSSLDPTIDEFTRDPQRDAPGPGHENGQGHGTGSDPSTGSPELRASPVTADPADGRLRIAIVNDYELVVRGLHAMLAPFGDRLVVVEHETEGAPEEHVDIALFDTFAARRDALQRAKQMIEADNVDRVVLYTWDAPPEFVHEAREIGVAAVIPKTATASELAASLERVANGERVGLDDSMKGERSRVEGPELTVREQEVLALLALGMSNAEIAHELFLSVDTIKTHVRRVFNKLGVNNRTQAAMRVVTAQNGLHRQPARSAPS